MSTVGGGKQGRPKHGGSYITLSIRRTQGYLPGQLYKLDSSYGNKEQLTELTTALKAAGLRPVADIVINHRCADQQDENGIWNMFKCAHCIRFQPNLPMTDPNFLLHSHLQPHRNLA